MTICVDTDTALTTLMKAREDIDTVQADLRRLWDEAPNPETTSALEELDAFMSGIMPLLDRFEERIRRLAEVY